MARDEPFWPAFLSGFLVGFFLWVLGEVGRSLIERADALKSVAADACILLDMLESKLRDLAVPSVDHAEVVAALRVISEDFLSTGLRLLHGRRVGDCLARAAGAPTSAARRDAARALVSLSWQMRSPIGKTRQEVEDTARGFLRDIADIRRVLGCEALAMSDKERARSVEAASS